MHFCRRNKGGKGGGVAGLEFTLHPPPPIPLHAYIFHMLEMRAHSHTIPECKALGKETGFICQESKLGVGEKEHG